MGSALQHHDATGHRRSPAADRGQDCAGIERETRAKRLPVIGNPSPIPDRVSDQQDDDADSAVAAFALDPALKCLEVVNSHLSLNPNHYTTEANLCVPRPEITWDREWYLSPPGRIRMKLIAQPFQEVRVAGISNGIGIGVRSGDELEANRCACERELGNGHGGKLSSLDAAEH